MRVAKKRLLMVIMMTENQDEKEKFREEMYEKFGLDEYKLENIEKMKEDVFYHIIKKEKGRATELVVNTILQNEYIYTTRDDEHSEMWIYCNGIYIPQGKTFVREYCRRILGDCYTTTFSNMVIDKIETDTYINQKEFFEEKEVEVIPVENGLLNLKTRELSKFTPNKIFFNKIPIVYDPEKKCPNIKRYLHEILPDKCDITLIEEIFGFLLYNDYFLEKSIMFTGTGRNGKGKLLSLMQLFIGADNCAEIPLEDLEKDAFALGELFKKKANLCGDLSTSALRKTGIFKKLTGRDYLSAARKFKTRVYFTNYAKMIFSANELPLTYDLTPAFWNRWILISFPYRFLPESEIAKLDESEKKNVKAADPHIIDKLNSPEEMSGLLNIALDGLKRLFENEQFTKTQTARDVERMWKMKSDSCLAFIEEYVLTDENSYVTKEEFRREYARFCRKNKLKHSTDKKIKEILETYKGVSSEYKRIGDERKNCWVGIKLKMKKDMIYDDVKGVKGVRGYLP